MALNDTLDHPSDSDSTGGPPATVEQQVAISVVISILALWTTTANAITILAITTCRYMRTKTNIFLLSLAISDLLSGAVASPLWLYRRTWGFSDWKWGDFTCKLYWFTEEATSYCTSCHIASFAVWRFLLIKFPFRLKNVRMRVSIIWTTVVWTLAVIFGGFGNSSLTAAVKKSGTDGSLSALPMCSLHPDKVKLFLTYYTISTSLFVLLPMCILFLASLSIAWELSAKKPLKKQSTLVRERQAVLQLALVASSFCVGYIPLVTYQLWTPRVSANEKLDYWFGVGAYFSLRLSESMNPILYNIASRKMRSASKEVLSNIRVCKTDDSQSHSDEKTKTLETNIDRPEVPLES